MKGTPPEPGEPASAGVVPQAGDAIAAHAFGPAAIRLADLRPGMDEALDVVTEFSLAAIRETAPEAVADPASIPRFNFPEMRAMHAASLQTGLHRFLLAVKGEPSPSTAIGREAIVGHAIFSLKEDARGRWGNVFTLYVEAAWRRRGLARWLLQTGEDWFRENRCRAMHAATHLTNEKVLELMRSMGWRQSGPHEGRYAWWSLDKELDRVDEASGD